MNPNCRGYALPSLCYSVLPICRTPEMTNHQYFLHRAIEMEKERIRQLELMKTTTIVTNTEATTTTTSTTTSTSTMSTPSTSPPPATTTTTTSASFTKISTTNLALEFFPVDATPFPASATKSSPSPTPPTERQRPKMKKARDKKNKKHSTSTTTPALPAQDYSYDGRGADGDDGLRRQRRHFDSGNANIFLQNAIKSRKYFQTDAQMLSSHLLRPITETIQYQYPPTRSSENLRRICRNECELLENELCQKEYAIAKRHPAIGGILPLEDCHDLPKQKTECSSLGIAIDVDETEHCYWENGEKYRGTIAVSQSGKPCLTWARLMKEIANFPELAGQNYCR